MKFILEKNQVEAIKIAANATKIRAATCVLTPSALLFSGNGVNITMPIFSGEVAEDYNPVWLDAKFLGSPGSIALGDGVLTLHAYDTKMTTITPANSWQGYFMGRDESTLSPCSIQAGDVAAISCATAGRDERQALCGLNLELDNGGYCLTATDGRRLYCHESAGWTGDDTKNTVWIHPAAIAAAKKYGIQAAGISGGITTLKCGPLTIWYGDAPAFPNFRLVCPSSYAHSVGISASACDALHAACKALESLKIDKSSIKLEELDGQVLASWQGGSMLIDIPVPDAFCFSFNPLFLREELALRAKGQGVTLRYNDKVSPTCIFAGRRMALTMPMRS